MQVEIPKHAQFERRVSGPVWIRLGYSHDIGGMQKKLHAEESKQEADAVESGPPRCNAGSLVCGLGDVVVEIENRTGDVQRRVEDVGDVGFERRKRRLGCWKRYSISF